MSAQPLVWVVTPVHNGERYLSECIESVLAQTYANWEYLVVDNRSTDRTPEIVREYAERDPRIRLHSAGDFLPIIANWNRALRLLPREASYCKVVHADDTLFPECLERMVDVAERNPSVAIVTSYALWGNEVRHQGVPYPLEVADGREICRSTLLGECYVFGSPSSLLLRADLIRERPAFYDETNLHSDTGVCFELLRNADLGFVHQILTHTRVHDEAMTSFSSRVNTYHSGWLAFQTEYGGVYLDRVEDLRGLASQISSYAVFLAKSGVRLRFRDRRFREHHRATVKLALRASGRLLRGAGSPLPGGSGHAERRRFRV